MAETNLPEWPPCSEHKERLAFLERAILALREAVHACTEAATTLSADLVLVREHGKKTASVAHIALAHAEAPPAWDDLSGIYRDSPSGKLRALRERRLKIALAVVPVVAALIASAPQWIRLFQ